MANGKTFGRLVTRRDQTGEHAHLFAPAGFLDDTAFHRVLMIYGKTFTGGASSNHAAPKSAPAGKMLVFDESRVYGFSRMPHLHRWVRELEFHIYAADKHRSNSASADEPAETETKANHEDGLVRHRGSLSTYTSAARTSRNWPGSGNL